MKSYAKPIDGLSESRSANRTLIIQSDQLFFDWQDRLKKISSDVGNLLLGRYVFRETQAVIAKNPRVEGVFARWMRINYAHSMALGIRRAVDTDRRALSLANFLREMFATLR